MNIQHWFKKKVANWGSDINRLWKLLSRFGFAQTIVVLAALVTLISFFVPASSIHTFFSNITRPLIQNPLPHADPNRFSIAVAHLENDTLDQQSEKLLIEALRDFEGVQVLRVDRTIKISKGNIPEDAERAAEDEAKEYLRKTGADVLIWGTVLVEGDKVSPKLWWTISSDIALSKRRDIYMPTNFRLPQLFWTDLVKVIQMLVERQVEIVSEREGVLQADKLKLYIDKVSKILEVSDEKLDWREEDRARTSMILAASLFTLGEETRKNRPIARAITACREALRFYTLDKTPYEWGATNSILGGAFMIMGDREIGTERRKEAIAAFKEAIKGFPRDKSPFEWALVQFLMSSDILKIGEQELNSEKMEQAEIAARDGLKELSREKTPLRWANAQSILALILRTLGMQETGIVHLKEAESLYREVLQEFTRERVPLEWARAQSDLAVTLQLQGERTGSEKLLEEAKVAYQESLKVFSREKTPEEWANVQINLASTLKLLCIKGARMQMEEVKVTYRESIKKVEEAYRELLKVYDRTETPRLWAQVQIDLGDALEEELFWVSDDNTLLRVFKEASAAYYEALGLFTQDKAPSEWAKIQSRLGDLMSHMGDHIGSYMGSNIVRTYFPPYSIESANFFEGAASAYREALKVYKPENAFFDWADAQLSLGSSLLSLGKTEEAVSVYREALKANFREKHPLEWARMQSNLGNALVTLTLDTRRQNSTSYLKEAVTAYHEALKAYRLSSNISNSSNLWNQSFLEESLGDVLMTLSDREADSSWLEQGIKAYRRSLFIEEQIRAEGDGKRLTREPFQMVILYKKLGNAYSRRGMRENDMGFLLQAVVTYREALKNVIERGSQFDREEVQGNLANVLSELGLRENNIRRFSEALLLYVEVYWGKGLFGLPTIYSQYPGSYALLPSRDRKKMIAYMQQTAVTYREALRKTNREKKLNDWARLKEQLGDTLFIICWWDISGRSCTAHLKEVIDVYLTALKPNPDSPFIYFKLCSAINVRIKSMDEEERASYLEELKGLQKPKGEQAPFVHVIVKETLGNLLSRNGVRHNIKELKEAVAAYREALQEYKLLGLQQQIQNVRISLLHTLISLGERETDADQLEETLILYREEFKELKGREAPYQWEGLGDLLKKLGERRAGTARLEEAEEAYQHALSGLKSSYPTGYGTNYIAKDGDSYNEQIKNKEQIKKIEDKQAVVRELLAKRKK